MYCFLFLYIATRGGVKWYLDTTDAETGEA